MFGNADTVSISAHDPQQAADTTMFGNADTVSIPAHDPQQATSVNWRPFCGNKLCVSLQKLLVFYIKLYKCHYTITHCCVHCDIADANCCALIFFP